MSSKRNIFYIFVFFILTLSTILGRMHLNAQNTSFQKNASSSKHPFKHYVLALSWSSTYCLLNASSMGAPQCKPDKYNFIVHGLWPQPSNKEKINQDLVFCDTSKEVSGQIIEKTFSIMPSTRLIQHSWRKHGSCSGLSPQEYFSQIKSLYKEFNIKSLEFNPDDVVQINLKKLYKDIARQTNIDPDHFSITCQGRLLKEVRICMDRSFKPTSCKKVLKNRGCTLKSVYIPDV